MNTTANKVIGQELRSLREQSSLTQEQLANRLCVTQSIISKIEAGKRNLQIVELFTFSGAIGITPDRLYLIVRAALKNNEETSHLVRS